MRRTLALLLSAVFSFPLIAPAFFASTDSDLPACCRRNGKHHCAMVDMDARAGMPAVPDAKAIQPKCPYYPATLAVPGVSNLALLENSQALVASLFDHSAVPTRTEEWYRISSGRSHRKRGPPAPLS